MFEKLFDVEPNVQTTKATPNNIETLRSIFVILEIFFTPQRCTHKTALRNVNDETHLSLLMHTRSNLTQ
jgi:hypothetical protein